MTFFLRKKVIIHSCISRRVKKSVRSSYFTFVTFYIRNSRLPYNMMCNMCNMCMRVENIYNLILQYSIWKWIFYVALEFKTMQKHIAWRANYPHYSPLTIIIRSPPKFVSRFAIRHHWRPSALDFFSRCITKCSIIASIGYYID